MEKQVSNQEQGTILKCTLCPLKKPTTEEIKKDAKGKEKQVRKFFKCINFSGTNIKFERTGYYTVCKACLRAMCCNDLGELDRQKFIETMKFLNKPFHQEIFENCLKSENDTLGEYMKVTGLTGYAKETFEDSDNAKKYDSLEIDNNAITIINNNDVLQVGMVITSEDIKIEKDVIRLLGYNPFDGYGEFDKKYLNGELIPYLDEQTLEDQFKVSVIIQIVNNNNQIRKIDLVINQLSSDSSSLISNSNAIKGLTAIKAQLTQASDKLAKENSISVKNRADKKSGQSTIGSMMKQLRELGFENAEHDYYDMQKAYGMKQAADISNKSICDILNFDEKDMDDMFKSQRDLIKDLQEEKSELIEKIRIISTENFELKEQLENN